MDKFEQICGNYYTSYPLRISEDLMDKIKLSAIKDGRSVNKQIECAIKEFLEKKKED